MKNLLCLALLCLPACSSVPSGAPVVPDSVRLMCAQPGVLRVNLGSGRYYDCKANVIRRWKDLVLMPV